MQEQSTNCDVENKSSKKSPPPTHDLWPHVQQSLVQKLGEKKSMTQVRLIHLLMEPKPFQKVKLCRFHQTGFLLLPLLFLSCGKSKEQFGILALAWSSTNTIKLLCNKNLHLQITRITNIWSFSFEIVRLKFLDGLIKAIANNWLN